MDQALKAVRALHADELVHSVITSSSFQVMAWAQYKDEETGITIPVRGLIDIVPTPESKHGKMLCDLKTTNDAAPFFWPRTINSRGYHVQAALYLDLWNAVGVSPRSSFGHIIQESESPYEVCTRILSDDFLSIARGQYLKALKAYCICIKTNEWPGYDEDESDGMYDGWTLVQPEPWMIMRAGVDIPDSPMPTFGEKKDNVL